MTKIIAIRVVNFARMPPAPVLPKTDELPPPKITPMPSLPDWSKTSTTSSTQTIICNVRIRSCTKTSRSWAKGAYWLRVDYLEEAVRLQ